MAKLDIERIISEYYMLKTVLNNKYALGVLSGKVQPAGPSAAADKKTLQAMQKYVKALGETVIPGNGLSQSETIDSYVDRLMKNFKATEQAKPASKRLTYSDNPFEESFRPYVSTVLSKDNAKVKIENAIRSNPSTLDSVNSLVVNLGGKKQSSYVRLLSQSTELFSTVSGLKNRIEKLQAQRKADKAEIERLQKELEEKAKEAQNYKELCEKAIEEIGDNISYTVMVGMLKQTSEGLEGIVRSEGQKTREHVTSETNRVIDVMTAKDKIKSYMYDQGKSVFPRFFIVMQNEKPLNNLGMNNLYKDIVVAASKVGIPQDHPAVEALYNDLRDQRLKNDNSPTVVVNNNQPKKSKHGVRILSAALVLALIGGGYLGYKVHDYYQQNSELQNQVDNVTNAFDDSFQGEYAKYQERENQQYDDYVSKVDIAVKDGTLVSLPGITPTPGATNGEVWTQDSLALLLDKYAADDTLKADLSGKLNGVDWERTGEMSVYTQNAINQIRADYYKNHFDLLTAEVSNLNNQVSDLTSQLADANALNASLQAQNNALAGENQQLKDQIKDLNNTIASLQNQVKDLQAQVDALQAIVDSVGQPDSALVQKIAELTSQLNDANAQIADLQAEVDSLSAENAALRQEVAQLKDQIKDLNKTIDTLEGEISVLENTNKTLATEKADLINQVNELKALVQKLEQQIADMGDTDGLLQAKAELEEKVAELEARVNELETENQQLTDKLVEYEEKVKDLEQDVKDLTDSLNKANSENESLKVDNTKLLNQIYELTNSLRDARAAYNQLYDQYQNLLDSGADSVLVSQLQEKLNNAYAEIASYEGDIVALYNGITKESATSADAKSAMENLFKMFGIEYSQTDSPSNDGSEYQPQA